ncbi:hypothetical protein C6A85_99115 [Mycobacterium sp. ITM-2017-0098]|nr:hypothetical protein C6A85_99115 [Mycobacterium sp. ITM-2017-0098]
MWLPGQQVAYRRRVTVHTNPISRTRISRITWSLFRHPVKSREFPAKAERLITADELVRYGV